MRTEQQRGDNTYGNSRYITSYKLYWEKSNMVIIYTFWIQIMSKHGFAGKTENYAYLL